MNRVGDRARELQRRVQRGAPQPVVDGVADSSRRVLRHQRHADGPVASDQPLLIPHSLILFNSVL